MKTIALVMKTIALVMKTIALVMKTIALVMKTIALVMKTIALVVKMIALVAKAYAIANITDISQECISRFTKRWGGWARFKKILLLLLDSLHSGSNKNFTDLSEDEQWLAREYFPILITESESSPEDALKHIAEVATSISNTAMQRVLHFCNPQVRANLLMAILRCLPSEVYSISVSSDPGLSEEAALSPCTVFSADFKQ